VLGTTRPEPPPPGAFRNSKCANRRCGARLKGLCNRVPAITIGNGEVCAPYRKGTVIAKAHAVHRRLRDAVITVAVLLVLGGTLLTISPALRERVAQVTTGQVNPLQEPRQIVSKEMNASGATAIRYASNNTYMVVFLIVAGVLFVLMLRA
jgi:hypothetical protein